jgi:tetratricopeptide (TPR) repeat protein
MEERERREQQRKLVEVVAGFIWAAAEFEEIHKAYKAKTLTFKDMGRFIDDRGKSLLFKVKESCHALFRGNVAAGLEKEQLFDLAIGTIFHEAMKLRENLYQLEVYGAKGQVLEGREGRRKYKEDFLRQLRKTLGRAERRFKEGMEETRTLLHDATDQLKSLLPDFYSNRLLLRFFLEHPAETARVFGEGGVAKCFEVIHPGGPGQGFAEAGRSYLASARYARACECFRQSLEAGLADPTLPALLSFANGMSLYYAGDLAAALEALQEVIPEADKHAEIRALRPEIGRVARRIAEELRAQGLPGPADRALDLAEGLGDASS